MKKQFSILLFFFFVFSINGLGQVRVKGYYRKDGTYVKPHYRSSPNSRVSDNYTYKGNVNPYTGEIGQRTYEFLNSKRVYKKASTKKVKITNRTYFHPSDGTKSKLSIFSKDKEVEVIGYTDNGYYLVKNGEAEGFVKKEDIEDIDINSIKSQSYSISDSAFYSPKYNLDSTKYQTAKIVVNSAFLKQDEMDSYLDSVIVPFGSEIKVLQKAEYDYYLVQYGDNLGVMFKHFFKITKSKRKKTRLFPKINFLKY